MKHIIYNIAGISLSAFFALSVTSCEDYLDKAADTDVSETIAFQNFQNFQGFVEEMYNAIPEKESCFWCTTFNWGDDEIMNSGMGNSHMSAHMDLGDYRHWMNDSQNFLGKTFEGVVAVGGIDPSSTNKFDHRIYGHSWYCIRKCNIGLQAIEDGLASGCTPDELNVIKGQLYFFRAWWHHEVMMFFGGMPYIDKVLNATDDMSMKRPSFQESAKRVAQDFITAAQYLPINWDTYGPGINTIGKNDLRVSRATALAYAGKALLWAASPLMNNNDEGIIEAGDKTYDYNRDLAKQAAEQLGKALTLVEGGKTPFSLAEFDYSDIYNHKQSKTASSCFSEIFYTTGKNWQMAGSTEAMLRGCQPDINGSNWNFAKLWGPKLDNFVGHDQIIHLPTANYVNYAYGMANGLPLDDPESGFDPTHPFKDRDPRFYHDIVFDGMHLVETNWEEDLRVRQNYASLYSGGFQRDPILGSRTGYFCQKLVSKSANEKDKMYEWNGNLQCYLPYMRLADVYLLYAEAAVAASQGNGSYNYAGTAVDAINKLRDRVGAGHVADKYANGGYHTLMDEVRRERACELAFEGHRWNDLQRWLLLTSKKYTQKTSQEFMRALPDRQISVKISGNMTPLTVWNEWYEDKKNDPRDAEVSGWSENLILIRQLQPKHYWFPLPDADVYLYEEFEQNPGW